MMPSSSTDGPPPLMVAKLVESGHAGDEAKLLADIGIHPNIVCFYGVVNVDRRWQCLLLGRALGGELFDRVAQMEHGLDERLVAQWMRCCALVHVHANGVVHRQPENILLATRPTRRALADFGSASASRLLSAATPCGTRGHAPEQVHLRVAMVAQVVPCAPVAERRTCDVGRGCVLRQEPALPPATGQAVGKIRRKLPASFRLPLRGPAGWSYFHPPHSRRAMSQLPASLLPLPPPPSRSDDPAAGSGSSERSARTPADGAARGGFGTGHGLCQLAALPPRKPTDGHQSPCAQLAQRCERLVVPSRPASPNAGRCAVGGVDRDGRRLD